MALSVAKPKAQPKLTVVRNYGMQGGTYNPQQTYSPQNTYNPQQTYNPQKTGNPQAAATAAAIARAVEAQRVAAAAQAARVREVLRVQVQGQVDSKTNLNVQKFKLAVAAPTFQGKLKVSKKPAKVNFIEPQQTEYEREYVKAYTKALEDFDKQLKPGKKNFLQTAWDKATFGQDRRVRAARDYAKKQADKYQTKPYRDYQRKIGNYLRDTAKGQAEINALAASGKATDAQVQALVDKVNARLEKQYVHLTKAGAQFDGSVDSFTKNSSRPITSLPAKFLKTYANVAKNIAEPIARYTIGGGSKNVPSLVTAASRLVNFAGNLNTPDRVIQQYGGKSTNRQKSGQNAWQATYDQRNFNIKPYVDLKLGKQADKAYGNYVRELIATRKKIGEKDPNKLDYNKVMQGVLEYQNQRHRNMNSALELGADPLLPAAASIKAAGKVGVAKKLVDSKFLAKPAQKAIALKNKVASNKVVSWLGQEHQTVAVKRQKFVEDELDDIYQKKPQVRKFVDQWAANKGNIKAAEKLRITKLVEANFAGLTKKEIKAFQHYYLKGNWSTKAAQNLTKAQKDNLIKIANKERKELGDLHFKENAKGIPTPYRENYLPQYPGKWSVGVAKVKNKIKSKDSADWWFTKQRKANRFQSKKGLQKSIAARKYHSATARQDLPVLRNIVAGHKDIGRNVERIEKVNKHVKPSLWDKASKPLGMPVRAWKKAVLLGNPAWYVNNEIFNQMRGIKSGGVGFLKNQRKTGKHLEHLEQNAKSRYTPSIARKRVKDVVSTVAKEIGHSKLARVATKQENRPRIALYRTHRQKGLTHEQAVKKVDSAFFNYTTKNIERPIKTLFPFYHWSKNLTKAAVRMPVEHTKSAITFNRVDRYQRNQFDVEFEKIVPELKQLGLSDSEVAAIKEKNGLYFSGRLKVGDKWITTPFNAFSEKGLTNVGANPYLAAFGEVTSSKDYWGRTLQGSDSSLLRRIATKFPQLELGRQLKRSWDVQTGRLKPSQKYIGKEGSDGFGLTKEKQGHDPTKPNYVASMDPRRNLGQNALAFLGVPRAMEFDAKGIVQRAKFNKLTADYFKLDVSKMTYEQSEAARQALFGKYGVTADQFYKGILSKYDSDQTTKIKKLKESAKIANNKLFEEYGRQPYGTRAAWASKKLTELVRAGYFDDNPYLASFVKGANIKSGKGWLTPSIIAKQKYGSQKKADYDYAKRTGDWSKYHAKYGVKQTQKSKDYQQAKKTGNWTSYVAKYGRKSTKHSPYQFEGKFFKTADSMEKYKEGIFWQKYENASPEDRRTLLAKNPQYNRRSNWTAADWLADKKTKKSELKKRAQNFAPLTGIVAANKAATEVKATRFRASVKRRQKKVVFTA